MDMGTTPEPTPLRWIGELGKASGYVLRRNRPEAHISEAGGVRYEPTAGQFDHPRPHGGVPARTRLSRQRARSQLEGRIDFIEQG